MNNNDSPRTEDFHYDLPDAAIARHPVHPRSAARMLFVPASGEVADLHFTDLPDLMAEGDQLWHNNTRVLQARLMLQKPTGGRLELFLLEPANDVVEASLAARAEVEWFAFVRGGKRWRQGEAAVTWSTAAGEERTLRAERMGVEEGTWRVRLAWDFPASFAEVIDELGAVPLPPYLGRDAEETDVEDYQTIYAAIPGSVAAPTAGLHYDEALWDALQKRGVRPQPVTLHVGAGTFKPLGDGGLTDHAMHAERCLLDQAALEALAAPGVRRFGTGTTTLRTLESLFWYAVLWRESGEQPEHIPQWVWRDRAALPAEWGWKRLDDVARWMLGQGAGQIHFSTSIMIIPGYRIRSIDFLVTNFHMPKSTLLCLISAVVGADWRAIYAQALQSGYRFLSYGDGSLLEVREQ